MSAGSPEIVSFGSFLNPRLIFKTIEILKIVFSMKSRCYLMFGTYFQLDAYTLRPASYKLQYIDASKPLKNNLLLLGINTGFFHAEIMLGQKPICGPIIIFILLCFIFLKLSLHYHLGSSICK